MKRCSSMAAKGGGASPARPGVGAGTPQASTPTTTTTRTGWRRWWRCVPLATNLSPIPSMQVLTRATSKHSLSVSINCLPALFTDANHLCRWASLPWNDTSDLPCRWARVHGSHVHKANWVLRRYWLINSLVWSASKISLTTWISISDFFLIDFLSLTMSLSFSWSKMFRILQHQLCDTAIRFFKNSISYSPVSYSKILIVMFNLYN